MRTSYTIKLGFYYTNLIYSRGTIILYFNSDKNCFQFLYTKHNVGNFLYVLAPIIFVMDERNNIIGSQSLKSILDKDYELCPGIRVSIETNEGNLNVLCNDKTLRISKAELLIAKQTFLISAIQRLPSLYDFSVGLDKEIGRLKNYISSIELDAILSSLEVSVSESFISKVGGDDRYSVNRLTTTSLPNIENDNYLTQLLSLGRKNLYEDSGYTSAYSMALPNLKTGVMAGRELSVYLQSLRDKYSAIDHITFLIKEWCIGYVSKYTKQRSSYEEQLSEIEKIFEQVFLLKFYKTGYLDNYGVKFVGLENKQSLFDADKKMRSFERMNVIIDRINETIFKYADAISSAKSDFVNTIIDLQYPI